MCKCIQLRHGRCKGSGARRRRWFLNYVRTKTYQVKQCPILFRCRRSDIPAKLYTFILYICEYLLAKSFVIGEIKHRYKHVRGYMLWGEEAWISNQHWTNYADNNLKPDEARSIETHVQQWTYQKYGWR